MYFISRSEKRIFNISDFTKCRLDLEPFDILTVCFKYFLFENLILKTKTATDKKHATVQ